MYAISRSYSAFCKLHVRLQRSFPKMTLPHLPLDASLLQFQKKSKSKRRGSVGQSLDEQVKSGIDRASLVNRESGRFDLDDVLEKNIHNELSSGHMSPVKTSKYKLNKNSSEVVSQRKSSLTTYLQALKNIPEVVVSDPFVSFLDESSNDGDLVSPASDSVTIHTDFLEVLLQNESPSMKVVVRNHIVTFDVQPSDVVVWKFSTKSYDIGFSVAFNEKDVLAYQRYNSHLQVVKGSIVARYTGKISLVWDNSYSLMRSKNLSYFAKLCDTVEIDNAKEISSEVSKGIQKQVSQRQVLFKALQSVSRAADATRSMGSPASVIYSPSNTTSTIAGLQQIKYEEEMKVHKDTISGLEEEKNSLKAQVSALDINLNSEKANVSKLTIEIQKLKSDLQLRTAREEENLNEIQMLRNQVAKMSNNVQELESKIKLNKSDFADKIKDLELQLETATNRALSAENEVEEMIQLAANNPPPPQVVAIPSAPSSPMAASHSHEAISASEEAGIIQKLKTERKFLKDCAREFKVQIDSLQTQLEQEKILRHNLERQLANLS